MSSNFSFPAPPSKSTVSKLHISAGKLPTFVDPKQAPTKYQPWRLIRETPFIKSVNLVIPLHLYETIWPASSSPLSTQNLATSSPTTSQQQSPTQIEAGIWYKVILKLSDIMSEPFFNYYIKTGNLLMISEGNPGIDDYIFTLHDGVLRMDLSRTIYERTGIQGQVVRNNGGGRKHGKERWKVEVNLRSDSMKKGKKGFERLLRASREVFDRGLVWVVRDVQKDKAGREKTKGVKRGRDGEAKEQNMATQDTQQLSTKPVLEPILSFVPTTVSLSPTVRTIHQTQTPELVSSTALLSSLIPRPAEPKSALPLETHEDFYEILEYFDMLVLDSPQIPSTASNQAKTDPYLSRYQIPPPPPPSQNTSSTDLKVLEWKNGLIDSGWVINLLAEIIRRSRTHTTTTNSTSSANQDSWAALTITSHRTEATGQTDGYTILLQSQSPLENDDTDQPTTKNTSTATATATAKIPPKDESQISPTQSNTMQIDTDKPPTVTSSTSKSLNSLNPSQADNSTRQTSNNYNHEERTRPTSEKNMDEASPQENNNNNDINKTSKRGENTIEAKTQGFQTFICFQHVDS